MREILFRGKREDNGEWVYGYLVKLPSAIMIGDADHPWFIYVPPRDPDDNGGYYRVIPDTVGQYTGMTDKNGKKIFEGDILKWDEREFGGPHFELATWDYGLFAMRANDWSEFCVVYENIHDNPELLEVEK